MHVHLHPSLASDNILFMEESEFALIIILNEH